MKSHLSISVWTRGGVEAAVKEEMFVVSEIKPQLYFGQLPLLPQGYVKRQLAGMVTVTLTYLPSFVVRLQLDAFAKLWRAIVSFVMTVRPSVCPSVRMKQLGSLWTDFNEI